MTGAVALLNSSRARRESNSARTACDSEFARCYRRAVCSDFVRRATTLHAFLFVHRLIGLFEQLFEARHAFRFERGDADTESEFMTASFGSVVGFQVLVESCDRVFFARVQIGDEHGELVAAEARDDVGAAEAAIEYRGRVDERVVAFVMSKLVVDLLHAVEVDEEQQQFSFCRRAKSK
jgi:hypothetical protein